MADRALEKALALHRAGRLDEAADLYRRTISQNPKNADAPQLLGVILAQRGETDAALALFDRSLSLQPKNAAAHLNRGTLLQRLGRFEMALASFDAALTVEPGLIEALVNRGSVLSGLGRHADALVSYARALANRPNDAPALAGKAALLQAMGKRDEALACFDRALAIAPGFAAARVNRGNLFRDIGRVDSALADYERALAADPENREAALNHAALLLDLRRYSDAGLAYTRLLARYPDNADAYLNRGAALHALRRTAEALEDYDRARALRPGDAQTEANRGAALREMGRFEEAITAYERALESDPRDPVAFAQRLYCQLNICDWRDYEHETGALRHRIACDDGAIQPFIALTVPLPAELQRKNAERYCARHYTLDAPPFPAATARAADRLRLGYFSADFHDHATAYLMAELFERHDRERFELTAFSFGPASTHPMRARLERAFDRFEEVGQMTDRAIAGEARRLGIDIAIDLKGYTQDCRPAIFAHRAAPLQVQYLGFPGTMGAPFIDYLIADSVIIPAEQRGAYSEKIASLPNSYQVNDSKRVIAADVPSRDSQGLPPSGFVFCCFNSNFKIAPQVFAVWMRLLQKVPGSVLWLLAGNPLAVENLRGHARAFGVAPERLVFAPRAELAVHLARHRLADLFLDTLPCNAHTTASDALWAGLPVLTCAGENFAGRVAASLLQAHGLPELIARDLADYERLALELAQNSGALQAIKRKLAASRDSCALFDTARFTADLEALYLAMSQRHRSGLPPDHLCVADQVSGPRVPS